MGSDLFGSLAESTCASLVVGATSGDLLFTNDAMYFPLMLTASGILVSFLTQFFACNLIKVRFDTVESTVKWQLIISTLLMTGIVYPITYVLPDHFAIPPTGTDYVATYSDYNVTAFYSNGTNATFNVATSIY
jgi:H+-translocating diphosphatase